MARLGVWTRLGIVLSVIGFGYGTFNHVNERSEGERAFREVMFNVCTADADRAESEGRVADHRRCYQERWAELPDDWPWWKEGMMIAGTFVLLSWILAAILLVTIRWILAGRKKVS